MTTTTPSRAKEERAIRLALLVVPLASLVPAEAVLIWLLGFAPRHHHVAYALTVAAISAVIIGSTQVYVYRLRIKRLRKL